MVARVLAVLGVVIALSFAHPAQAQNAPPLIGGNNDSGTSQTLTGAAPALMTGPVYTANRFDQILFLARVHQMVVLGTSPSPTSGMFVARSVRFASAGKPDAWVRRITSR